MANFGPGNWTTIPNPTQARASLGVPGNILVFPFNPDTVQWDYKENIASWDTLGGRVVQLLSVSLNGIIMEGRAGSRREMQAIAKRIKGIMGYHVRTLNPVQLKVPSRNWKFDVYVQAMPQIGWEVASTSYPYMLQLMVDEDLNGIKTKEVSVDALQRLASGIGFDDSSLVHGGNIQEFSEIIDIMTAPKVSALTGSTSGGLGVGSEITFPMKTTQTQIKKGGWCYQSQSNCHHDYNAADIFVPTGTVNVSPVNGVVTSASDHDSSSVGSRVQIKADDGLLWYMAHMGDGTITVKSGDRVTAGQEIGKVGTSADAMGTPPHLHIDCGNWSARPACSGSACSSLPFINVQPALVDAFGHLPT